VTAADLRCPHCRGAVRADAQWCTQCWADLRPAPEPAVVAPVPALPAPGQPVDATTPRSAGLGGWPCANCGATNGVELDACAACGSGFLAGLKRDEAPLLALPVVGDITRLSRGQRLGLAAAVVLLVALLVAVVSLLAG
jgi:hypothetical protein